MFVTSLRAKILYIVMAFLSVIGSGFVLYSIFTTINYKGLRLEVITKTVEFETEKVNKTIAEIERGAVLFAIGGHLCYETKSKALGEEIVVEFLRSFPLTIGGGFWFAPYKFDKKLLREGFYAFYDQKLGDVRLDDTFFLDDYDYHNKSWYLEIANAENAKNEVAWTKPYYDDSGSYALMTTAGSCFYDTDGSLLAISTVDWEIGEVVRNLTSIKPTPGSFVILCDPQNDYIISNTMAVTHIAESLSSLPFNLSDQTFTLGDVTYMTFARPLDNGWLLSVQIPDDEIFSSVETRNQIYSIIIAITSLIMLFFAYLLISKIVNAPLQQLTQGVQRLGSGDLDARIIIDSTDEMGMLASTFNTMTVRLKDSIETNARVLAEKERISAELNVAHRIQASMLPCIFPPFPDRDEFDLYGSMEPAKEVGGDFYDFFLIDPDSLAVVIADVSGKGVPAALFMVITKTLIKNSALTGQTPAQVFNHVNSLLCEHNDANMFVTAFMGVYHISSGKFIYVNAGHNPPLIHRNNGDYERLSIKPGFVLAGMAEVKYTQMDTTLNSGDSLYLYTDGVTEAINNEGNLFTEQRLLGVCNKNKEQDIKQFVLTIKSEIDSFAQGAEQADDITMLILNIGRRA